MSAAFKPRPRKSTILGYYRRSSLGKIRYVALGLASCGILSWIASQNRRAYARWFLARCPPKRAQFCLLQSVDGFFLEEVSRDVDVLFFDYFLQRYSFQVEGEYNADDYGWRDWTFSLRRLLSGFSLLAEVDLSPSPSSDFEVTQPIYTLDLLASVGLLRRGGLSHEIAFKRRRWNGPNALTVLTAPLLSMLVAELLAPWMLFQMFAFMVWALDDYLPYAVAIIVMAWSSAAYEV